MIIEDVVELSGYRPLLKLLVLLFQHMNSGGSHQVDAQRLGMLNKILELSSDDDVACRENKV
jgi:hypothetical protein